MNIGVGSSEVEWSLGCWMNDLECLLEEVGSSFYKGHQASYGPMNPRQLIISSLDSNRPWSTVKMDSQRWWEVDLQSGGWQVAPIGRAAYRWGRPAPPCVGSGRIAVVCLGWWIRDPLSRFHRGWSWFAVTDRSSLPVFWLNPPVDINSPTLVEMVSLNS